MRTGILIFLLACRNDKPMGEDTGVPLDDSPVTDADQDGYDVDAANGEADCDDTNSQIHPGAEEICDGIDNNCDGSVDEGVTSTFFADADGDGFGDPDRTLEACDPPEGYTSTGTDCDDSSAENYPGAGEQCDGIDNDCDDQIDEDVRYDWYADADGDGFGDPDSAYATCDPPPGYVTDDTDCDDTESSAYPGGEEVCDRIDNDCDDDVDEGVTTTYYQDTDGDGFGVSESTVEDCFVLTGYAESTGDCDDTDSSISPNATEICDGVDNDCDGDADSDAVDRTTFFADDDSDGYGDATDTLSACVQPSGYVSDATDCDDGESLANPGETEVCDEIDNDCDGDTDEDSATDASTWYADSDGDGYGSTASTVACDQPVGFSANSTDCDDGETLANPRETEVCDDIDNDCDGDTDEGLTSSYYADSDGDGYGSSDYSISACSAPTGYVSDATDCDDGESLANPGETEVCDDIDNNCDGDTDEGVTSTFYLDADSDGHGAASWFTESCSAPTGYVSDATDCDDGEPLANPSETEVCDDIDNDCDGDTDEGLKTDWYLDYDGDTFGDPDLSTAACTAPSALYVSDNTDCDDLDSAVYPGAAEVCDGGDANCDGDVDNDGDGDGYADADCGGDDCNDDASDIVPELDGGCALGVSCVDIQDNGYDDGDGEYTIDPDGYDTGVEPFDVYCDMTTDGGGWTLIATISDDDDDNWSEFMPTSDAGLWDSTDTLGESITFVEDYKSAAYIHVDATALLIKEEETNVLQTQEDCWSTQPFLDFISSLSWSATGSDYTWDDSTGAYLCDFTHFGYSDTVLRAGDHSGSERVVGFKWGEADGAQDGNKDRTMITTFKANGYSYDHHVDLPTGLGGFTSYSGAENYEDANECQGDGPDRCTNANQNYQLFVR